jgi:hypothetical protein
MPGVVCERLEILHDGREVELVARAGEPSLGFDGDGRPTYPGCLLSISDNGRQQDRGEARRAAPDRDQNPHAAKNAAQLDKRISAPPPARARTYSL